MIILHSIITIHQIKHPATSKLGSQPSDSKWPLVIFDLCLCGYVWVNILNLSTRMVHFHTDTFVDISNSATLHQGLSRTSCDGAPAVRDHHLQVIAYVHHSTATNQYTNICMNFGCKKCPPVYDHIRAQNGKFSEPSMLSC